MKDIRRSTLYDTVGYEQMHIAHITEQDKRKQLLETVDEFKQQKQDLRRLQEENNLEQSTVNRLLKNEIIDMAERLERIEKVLERIE